MSTMTDDERYINAYRYLSQGKIWAPKDRPNLPITEMGPAWRRNAARWLERRAKHFDLLYSLGEALLASRLDLSDLAMDGLLLDQERREQDPVAWIRSTPLYRALVTGPCCNGTGMADYAAVPCPATECPFPQPGSPPERSPGWGVVLDSQAVTA